MLLQSLLAPKDETQSRPDQEKDQHDRKHVPVPRLRYQAEIHKDEHGRHDRDYHKAENRE